MPVTAGGRAAGRGRAGEAGVLGPVLRRVAPPLGALRLPAAPRGALHRVLQAAAAPGEGLRGAAGSHEVRLWIRPPVPGNLGQGQTAQLLLYVVCSISLNWHCFIPILKLPNDKQNSHPEIPIPYTDEDFVHAYISLPLSPRNTTVRIRIEIRPDFSGW